MDIPILISLAVLIIIAGAEMYCLFIADRKCRSRPPLTAVIPVLPHSPFLEAALDRTVDLILRGDCPINRILLINYGGDEAAISLCRAFCADFKEASLVRPEELEKILAETFAKSEKMVL